LYYFEEEKWKEHNHKLETNETRKTLEESSGELYHEKREKNTLLRMIRAAALVFEKK
jgi:hypothetical protein